MCDVSALKVVMSYLLSITSAASPSFFANFVRFILTVLCTSATFSGVVNMVDANDLRPRLDFLNDFPRFRGPTSCNALRSDAADVRGADDSVAVSGMVTWLFAPVSS